MSCFVNAFRSFGMCVEYSNKLFYVKYGEGVSVANDILELFEDSIVLPF